MTANKSGKVHTDFDYNDLSDETYQFKKNWKNCSKGREIAMIRFSGTSDDKTNIENIEKQSKIKPNFRMTDPKADVSWKDVFQKAHKKISLDEDETLLYEVFNRSENELKIDFHIDDMFIAILKKFAPETWQGLNDTERFDVVSEFVNALGKDLGLENIPDTIGFLDMYEEDASYIHSANAMVLKESFFDNPPGIINGIAHEMRHAYQVNRAGLLETREDLLYRINLENYISPLQLPDGSWIFLTDYQDQYVEVDARVFANLFTEALMNE